MFPPKRPGLSDALPPRRGMRDIRRDVGTTMPEPPVEDAGPSTATVQAKCPECGCKYDMRFTADAEDAGVPPVESQPLPTTGGGPV